MRGYGFRFVPVLASSTVVQLFVQAHLRSSGYPPDTKPAGTHWVAVCRGEGVYTVFGWHRLPDGRTIDLSDFYTYPGRLGVLAAYAALERIKADADRVGVSIVTLTPYHNTAMQDAYCKVFGLTQPSHVAYRYDPQGSR